MSNASRWSLIIDPQLQGRQWVVSKEAANNLCITAAIPAQVHRPGELRFIPSEVLSDCCKRQRCTARHLSLRSVVCEARNQATLYVKRYT